MSTLGEHTLSGAGSKSFTAIAAPVAHALTSVHEESYPQAAFCVVRTKGSPR
jgi:hypothetical protein